MMCAQLHPWFRLGLPLDLNLDMYNQHYLDLSRETGGAADRIRAVIREAIHSPRAPPEPAHAQVRRPDAPPSWAPHPGPDTATRLASVERVHAAVRARHSPVRAQSCCLTME